MSEEIIVKGDNRTLKALEKFAGNTVKAGLTGGIATTSLAFGFNQITQAFDKLLDIVGNMSPALQGSFKVLSNALGTFFKPFADFLGMLLMPVAVKLLKFIMWLQGSKWGELVLTISGGLAAIVTAISALKLGGAITSAVTGGATSGVGGAVTGGSIGSAITSAITGISAGTLTATAASLVTVVAGAIGIGSIVRSALGYKPTWVETTIKEIVDKQRNSFNEQLSKIVPNVGEGSFLQKGAEGINNNIYQNTALTSEKISEIRDKYPEVIDSIRQASMNILGFKNNTDKTKVSTDFLKTSSVNVYKETKTSADASIPPVINYWNELIRKINEATAAQRAFNAAQAEKTSSGLFGLPTNIFGTGR